MIEIQLRRVFHYRWAIKEKELYLYLYLRRVPYLYLGNTVLQKHKKGQLQLNGNFTFTDNISSPNEALHCFIISI